MILYKTGNYFFRYKIPFIYKIFNVLIRVVHNCAIYCETKIGHGTIFGYSGIGVVIHKRVEIGKNCTIGSNVTIGGKSKSFGVPKIGNNVYIATGAKILGDVVIGDDVVIGANSVVIDSIPSGCVVVGIPGKIIKRGIKAEDFY